MAETNLARIPAFMRDLADIAARIVADVLQLAPDEAERIGQRIAREACASHAREIIYIPSGRHLDITDRDLGIFARYRELGGDARNARWAELVASEFGISASSVRRRVRYIESAIANGYREGLEDLCNRT